MDPRKGNVTFGTGKDVWGFDLKFFAKVYSKKFGISVDKMINKLWGDNFFDAKAKKWRTKGLDAKGKPL